MKIGPTEVDARVRDQCCNFNLLLMYGSAILVSLMGFLLPDGHNRFMNSCLSMLNIFNRVNRSLHYHFNY